jgi:23S rRNA (adenine-N6)-dimethyltransferase
VKMARKRILLAQNFLRDPCLVASLVSTSGIVSTDVVYEIGPGEGIITEELAKTAGRVVAIEKDPTLVEKLRERFKNVQVVEVHQADFLRYDIKETDYKIFSNIPFNITSSIVRKILYAKHPPREAYLLMQKEAAEKFSGIPKETQFSVLIKPWFRLNIIRQFRRTDFEPVPDADVVLLNVKRRDNPLVSPRNAAIYREFVKYGFGPWKRNLKITYKRVFTYKQWKSLSRDLCFPLRATPTQLTFEQWIGLFECFLAQVPDFKKTIILEK